MDEDFRYGIIGTGMMGIEHIENINAIPGACVAAISDPFAGSRETGAAAVDGDPLVFEDHRDLLEQDLDAVVLASPNMTHIEILRDVLATEVAALVEKPLCTTVQDCAEVVALTDQRTALVWVGLEYRYMPPVARLIEELRRGTTGNIHMISIREHRFPFLDKVGNWNRLSANTGGTLVEKCCHFFDLMNLLSGANPTRVMASGGQDVNHLNETYNGQPSDILDNAYVIVEYDNGVRAMLDLCMFAEATHNQEEISVIGDKGKLEALIPENRLYVGRRGEHWIGGVEGQIISDDSIPYEGQHHGSSFVEHTRFIEAVRSGSAPEITVRDGLLSVAIGAAAHRSIDERRPVDMAEVLPSGTA
jgi:predicted dehydrogenase